MDSSQAWLLGGLAGAGTAALVGGALAAWPPKDRPRWVEGVADDALPIGAIRSGLVAPLAFLVGGLLLAFGVLGGVEFPPTNAAARLAPAVVLIAATCLMGGLIIPALGPRTASGWALFAALAAAGGIGFVAGPSLWTGALPGVTDRAAPLPAPWRSTAIGVGPLLVTALAGAWAAAAAWGTARLAQNGLRVAPGVVLVGLAAAVMAAVMGRGSLSSWPAGAGAALLAAGFLALPVLAPRARVPAAAVACVSALLGVLVVRDALYNAAYPLWLALALGAVAPAAVLADGLVARREGATVRTRTLAAIAAAATLALLAVAPGVVSLLTWDRPAPDAIH